jgi:hypothetical protein
VPQLARAAGARRPPDSRRRSEQAPNHALHSTGGTLAYPILPRFAAPVRPEARTATGLMQPGWPVYTPNPRHCGAEMRVYTATKTHGPMDRSMAFGLCKQL